MLQHFSNVNCFVNESWSMDYKKFNLRFLEILCTLVLIIVSINFFVNPFRVFTRTLNFGVYPELKKQERLTKLIQLEHTKDVHTLFIGTSRPDHSLDADYYEQLSGEKAFNLCIEASNFYEQRFLIKEALKIHPEIKKIIWGIDFDFFYNLANLDEKFDKSQYEKSLAEKYASILLSYDALGASITTISRSFTPNYPKGFLANGIKRFYHNEKVFVSFDNTLNQFKNTGRDFGDEPDLSRLKNFVNELEGRGVEVVLFIPPIHSSMYEIIMQNGAWNKIETFKLKLSEVKPFYDFYFPSVYSAEKPNPDMHYFFESSHCTYVVGNKMIERMLEENKDFGYLADSFQNIHTNFLTGCSALKRWEAENPEFVKRVKEIRERKEN